MPTRAASYGDGLFESMRSFAGRIPLLDAHLHRLYLGFQALGLQAPSHEALATELTAAALRWPDHSLKLIASAAAPANGYRRAHHHVHLQLICRAAPAKDCANGLRVSLCQTRLGSQPALTGLKTLNRLEQIIAANELARTEADEGLMLDGFGNLVCATSANFFAVVDGVLQTPRIERCGIRGVMRSTILALCDAHQIPYSEQEMRTETLVGASELFLCNAVRGIRPVASVRGADGLEFNFALHSQITEKLRSLLNRVGFSS